MKDIIFNNELSEAVKIVIEDEKANGMKGKKQIPHKYDAVKVQLNSINNSLDITLTKKELTMLCRLGSKFLKEAGRKSTIIPI